MNIWSFVWPSPTYLTNYLEKLQIVEEDCTVLNLLIWRMSRCDDEKLRWLKVWYVSVFVYLCGSEILKCLRQMNDLLELSSICLVFCICVFVFVWVRNIEMFCDNRINPRNCLPAVSLYKKRSPLRKVLANKNLLLTHLPYLRYIFPLSQNLNVSILEQSLALKWRQLHLYMEISLPNTRKLAKILFDNALLWRNQHRCYTSMYVSMQKEPIVSTKIIYRASN